MLKYILFLALSISVYAGPSTWPINYSHGCAYNVVVGACVPTFEDVGTVDWGDILGDISVQSDLKALTLPLSSKIYIDTTRTDVYTEIGSFLHPFKTFAAAHASAISRSLVSVTFDFLSTGTITEKIFLNSSLFTRVVVDGHKQITVNPVSGDSLQITTNNANLDMLVVRGFTFSKPVEIIGSQTGVLVGGDQLELNDDDFFDTVTIKNVSQAAFNGDVLYSSLYLENIGTGFATIVGGVGQFADQQLTLVSNTSNPKPSNFDFTALICEKAICGGDVSVDAGSLLQYREGARVGYPGGTITINGTLQAYTGFIRSDIVVNNGGSATFRGADSSGSLTINSGGSVTNLGGPFKSLINGAPEVTNAILSVKNGHIQSAQTTAPTATVNANAGTGASCSLANATDSAGIINLTTTATAPSSGEQCKVNFNMSHATAPIVVLQAANAATASALVSSGEYATSATGTFSVNFASTDLTGHTYKWFYYVIETQ